MANYVLVRHKVRDFAEWKSSYDAHLSQRIAAGITQKKLLRSESNPNEVVLLFEAADVKRAQKFCDSPGLKEAMQKAGVTDKPDVYFLND